VGWNIWGSIQSIGKIFIFSKIVSGAGIAQTVQQLVKEGRSRDLIPVKARFTAPVQTGPGTHPASYITRTGSFPGVKRMGHGVDRPPPSTAEFKERL
jgi:hypothetical protein